MLVILSKCLFKAIWNEEAVRKKLVTSCGIVARLESCELTDEKDACQFVLSMKYWPEISRKY